MAEYTPLTPGLISDIHLRDRTPDLHAAIISTGVAALVAVSLRLLSRKLSKTKLWLDDYLVILSLFVLAGIVYIAIWGMQTGLGRPYQVGSKETVHENLKQVFIAEFLYTILLSLVKFSVLAFYWRTFNVTYMKLHIALIACVVFGWMVGVVCTYLIQCRPVEEFWLRTKPDACPIDEKEFMIWSAVPNIATDVALLILPMFPIWSLKKNVKQRIALCVVFGLGSITLFASLARLVATFRADFLPLHISWTLVDFLLWSIVEAATAVIAANLPFLKPLYSQLADKTQQVRHSWATKRSSWSLKRTSSTSSTSSASSRYSISPPQSVRGSKLVTHIRSLNSSSGPYDGDDTCDITLIPVEMLARYDQLDDGAYSFPYSRYNPYKPASPTVAVVPENFQLRDLEKAVIRPLPHGYDWQ